MVYRKHAPLTTGRRGFNSLRIRSLELLKCQLEGLSIGELTPFEAGHVTSIEGSTPSPSALGLSNDPETAMADGMAG